MEVFILLDRHMNAINTVVDLSYFMQLSVSVANVLATATTTADTATTTTTTTATTITTTTTATTATTATRCHPPHARYARRLVAHLDLLSSISEPHRQKPQGSDPIRSASGRLVPCGPRHLPQIEGRLQLERNGWSMVWLCQSSLYSKGRWSMVTAHWYDGDYRIDFIMHQTPESDGGVTSPFRLTESVVVDGHTTGMGLETDDPLSWPSDHWAVMSTFIVPMDAEAVQRNKEATKACLERDFARRRQYSATVAESKKGSD